MVSMTQVLAAGMASMAAALITSRFGVAGTIAGAALTTMIITAGSAILRAYLESFSGQVRNVPRRFRDSIGQRKRTAQGGMAVYGRREGLAGRLRSALDWFAHLSSRRRVSILAGALVPAVIAFAIAMSGVTLAELTGGRTLSCMVWGKCQVASSGGGEIAGVEQRSGPSTSVGTLFSGRDAATESRQLPQRQTPVVTPQQQQRQQPGGSSWFWENEEQQQPVITPQQPQQEDQQQPVITPQQPQQEDQQQPVVTPQQPVVTPQQPSQQQQQQQPVVPEQQSSGG
ncbi:hypothetical protein RxyAA322_12640 [Rubrobacter xylanophilus]|uniref:Uncharacterized protein n=1 Tax=Rubrobacter xylanophilus TaxID=49319 RepID=A0A510HHF0_9ACTN|nr:hypothetical protein RxyAA322_12640 [Rubrobacter xylanophilus]